MFIVEGKEKIYLINSDIDERPDIFCQDAYVITYGFNPKATLSVSSHDEGRMVMCLQRSITMANGKVCEPQEFFVSSDNERDAREVMLAMAVAIVCGASAEELGKLVF